MSEINVIHLTRDEVAARLRVSLSWLDKARRSGHGPRFLKAGRRVLYPVTAVEAFEAQLKG